MTFKELRQGGCLHTFDKRAMQYIKARIESVSAPYYSPSNGGQVGKVIDITVNVDGKKAAYVVGEDSRVNYLGDMTIAADGEQIKMEVEAIKASAEDAVKNYEHNKELIERSTSILAEIDPRVAESSRLDRLEKMIEGIAAQLKGL